MPSGGSQEGLLCPQEGLVCPQEGFRRVYIYIYMIIVQFKQSFNKLFLL